MRLIEYDPLTRTSYYCQYDEATDMMLTYEEQDVEQYLETAKALQNDPEYSRKGIKNDYWHYAHIPMGIVSKWMVEKGVNVFDKDHIGAVKRLINDPEYRWLKTTTGMHR